MSETARQDRLLKAALADFHKPVEPVKARVEWASIGRSARIAAERRAELGEAYWMELRKEWSA
jgi:hypothetical protein